MMAPTARQLPKNIKISALAVLMFIWIVGWLFAMEAVRNQDYEGTTIYLMFLFVFINIVILCNYVNNESNNTCKWFFILLVILFNIVYFTETVIIMSTKGLNEICIGFFVQLVIIGVLLGWIYCQKKSDESDKTCQWFIILLGISLNIVVFIETIIIISTKGFDKFTISFLVYLDIIVVGFLFGFIYYQTPCNEGNLCKNRKNIKTCGLAALTLIWTMGWCFVMEAVRNKDYEGSAIYLFYLFLLFDVMISFYIGIFKSCTNTNNMDQNELISKSEKEWIPPEKGALTFVTIEPEDFIQDSIMTTSRDAEQPETEAMLSCVQKLTGNLNSN